MLDPPLRPEEIVDQPRVNAVVREDDVAADVPGESVVVQMLASPPTKSSFSYKVQLSNTDRCNMCAAPSPVGPAPTTITRPFLSGCDTCVIVWAYQEPPPVGTKAFAKIRDRRTSTTST